MTSSPGVPRRIAEAFPLNRARDRRIFMQGLMCSDVVVVTSIGVQDSTQMRLAKNGDMNRSLAMNLGSTSRWVWIAVAVMAIAAAEYLMGPQIIPN